MQHILIISKEDRSIPNCDFYIGDGISGNFNDCPYRQAGHGENIVGTQPRQFTIFGIGNFIKIVFNKPPKSEGRNLAGQVALGLVKIYAQPMEFAKGIVNEEQPLMKGHITDEVDRVLLEMGVPLQSPALDWEYNEIEKSDALTYAPVDEDTRETLKDVQQQWLRAHNQQDFEKLASIGKDIKILLGIGNEILKLKRALQDVLRVENYDKAIDLRNQILQQEQKREAYDVIYETNRFEQMIEMDNPSDRFVAASR